MEVDGKFADAVLGEFGTSAGGSEKFLVAAGGRGRKDPLERPYGGRRMSAVDQGYRYAINLPCDWIVVTSIRQTRLYFKGADQQTYERFDTEDLFDDPEQLKRFVFVLGAERVVPAAGRCHLYELIEESEKVGRDLTKEFYLRYADIRQDAFERISRDNPRVARHDVLTATQKLLDRILFCAFCEDRGLLPTDTIRKTYEHRDPYSPRPIWETFRGLFRAINLGNAALGIHAYNGGLFAEDPLLESLAISDEVCAYFRELGDYDYRPAYQAASYAPTNGKASLIDVDILGHIFEQSITDLERLRNELDGLAEPVSKDRHKTRRKKEGAFYTPAFVTRYIVEQALGGVLRERFETLRRSHEEAAKGAAREALADPRVYTLDGLKEAGADGGEVMGILGGVAGRVGEVRRSSINLQEQGLLDRSVRPVARRQCRGVERSVGKSAGIGRCLIWTNRILENNLYGVDLNEEGDRDLPAEPLDQDGGAGQDVDGHGITRSAWAIASPTARSIRRHSTGEAEIPAGGVRRGRVRRGGGQSALRSPGAVRADQAVSPVGLRGLPRHGRPVRLLLRAGHPAVEAGRALVVHRDEQMDEVELRRAAAKVFLASGRIESVVDFGHAKQILRRRTFFRRSSCRPTEAAKPETARCVRFRGSSCGSMI